MSINTLEDAHGRNHNYLRVSLTDACNFRCFYCMPNEDISCTPHAQLMQVHEMFALAKLFVAQGVTKIRLTGGEPLVRKEAPEIIRLFSTLPVQLTLTTNAVLVDKFLDVLQQSSIRSLNVSLDTLDADKFFLLCKRPSFNQVWQNINLLLDNNFSVKINVVLIKGVNDNEILDFVALTKELPLHIRFIEFMPFENNQWQDNRLVPFDYIVGQVKSTYDVIKLPDEANATTKKFKVIGHKGTFAVISTMTNPFCDTCNRIRLTADGRIKNCLFSQGEIDLLTPYRKGEDVLHLIKTNISQKEKALGGHNFHNLTSLEAELLQNRSMISIGG